MPFAVGDKVVYPHHGAAIIERQEKRVFDGKKTDYFVLRITYGDLKVSIPVDKAEEIGLRDVINDEEVEEVFAVLRKKEARMPTNWSRRFKNHVEKLKSGDIYQVAEVVRNLSLREADKGLSAGEKRMLARARQILVSELTFALNVEEETAESRLDDVLAGARTGRRSRRRRPGQEDRRQEGAGRQSPRSAGRAPVVTVGPRPRRIVVAAGLGERFGSPKQFLARGQRGSSTTRSQPPARRATKLSSCSLPIAAWDGAAVTASVAGGAHPLGVGASRARRVPTDGEIVVVHDAARPLATAALFEP